MTVVFVVAILALSVVFALALACGILGSVLYVMTYRMPWLHLATAGGMPVTVVPHENQRSPAFLAPAA